MAEDPYNEPPEACDEGVEVEASVPEEWGPEPDADPEEGGPFYVDARGAGNAHEAACQFLALEHVHDPAAVVVLRQGFVWSHVVRVYISFTGACPSGGVQRAPAPRGAFAA